MLIKLGALMVVFIVLWIAARLMRHDRAVPPPAEELLAGVRNKRPPVAGSGTVALKEPEDN